MSFSSRIRIPALMCLMAGLLLLSCKKEKDPPAPPPQSGNNTTTTPDTIIFTDLSPDISLNSVNYMYPHPSNCGNVASPSDSTAVFLMDADSNAVADFEIMAKTFYQFVSASAPCANYNYQIRIMGLASGDSIAIETAGINEVNFLEAGDTISNRLKFNPLAFMYLNQPMAPFITFSGEKYIAIKRHDGQKEMFGWILVEKGGMNEVIIKEYGMNQTDGNIILAGQMN